MAVVRAHTHSSKDTGAVRIAPVPFEAAGVHVADTER